MQWTDRKIQCHWENPANTTYLRYHDEEWGRPVHDDNIQIQLSCRIHDIPTFAMIFNTV